MIALPGNPGKGNSCWPGKFGALYSFQIAGLMLTAFLPLIEFPYQFASIPETESRIAWASSPPSSEMLASFAWWQWAILLVWAVAGTIASAGIWKIKNATIEALKGENELLETEAAPRYLENMGALKAIADEADEKAKTAQQELADLQPRFDQLTAEHEELTTRANNLKGELDQRPIATPYEPQLIEAADALVTTASTTSTHYKTLAAGMAAVTQMVFESNAAVQFLSEKAAEAIISAYGVKAGDKEVETKKGTDKTHPSAVKKIDPPKDEPQSED